MFNNSLYHSDVTNYPSVKKFECAKSIEKNLNYCCMFANNVNMTGQEGSFKSIALDNYYSVYVKKGFATISTEKETHHIDPGDIILCRKGKTYNVSFSSDAHTYAGHFGGPAFDAFFDEHPADIVLFPQFTETTLEIAIRNWLRDTKKNMSLLENNKIATELLNIFYTYVFEHRRCAAALKSIPNNISNTVQYIQTHLSEEINIGDLAKMAGLGPAAYNKAFKLHLGETPKDYIKFERIREINNVIISGRYDSMNDIYTKVNIYYKRPQIKKYYMEQHGISPEEAFKYYKEQRLKSIKKIQAEGDN